MPGPFNSISRVLVSKDHIFCIGIGYIQMATAVQGRQTYRMQQVTQLAAFDRRSGKLAWQKMMSGYAQMAELLDGALWLGDHRTSGPLLPVDVKAAGRTRATLKRELRGAPDAKKLMKLARICADLGEAGEAVAAAAEAVEVAADADDGPFGEAYRGLEWLRFESASAKPRETSIRRVDPGRLKLDGRLGDWKGIPAVEISSRRHVALLAGREGLDPKAWTGPSDCSARVRTAWSEDGLHVAVEVTDEKHSNPQPAGALSAGDSVTLTLDLEPAGGYRYSTHDAEFGFALDDEGKRMSVKWLLAGRARQAETKSQCAVRRDEETKITTYEIRIAAEDIQALVLTGGRSFGMSIAVNDADGAKVESSLAIEPTIGGARVPAILTRCRLAREEEKR